LSTDEADTKLTTALAGITFEFSTDIYDEYGAPFMLWRGDQMAIGEAMTIKDGDEMFPIGYAAFHRQWTIDGSAIPQDGKDILEGNGDEPSLVDVGERAKDGNYRWSGSLRPWFRPIRY
jgi:hypothetical protein